MINTLFLTTVAVEPTLVAFHQDSRTYVRGLSCHSFKFLWRTGKTKPPTFRHCRVHFLRQPFSKQLYTSWLLRRNEKQGFYSHTPHIRSLCSYTIPCRSRSLAFCISTKVYPVQCEYSLLRSVFIIKSLNFLDLKQRTTDHNKDENPQQHHDTRMDA